MKWIPRNLNTEADYLSKHVGFSVVVNPRAIHLFYLAKRLKPTVHAFCTREGKVPQAESFWHMTDSHAVHIDFMTHIWDSACLPLASPEWKDLAKVLGHLQESGCAAMVICPIWYNANWWPLLNKLKVWHWLPPTGTPMFMVVGSETQGFCLKN